MSHILFCLRTDWASAKRIMADVNFLKRLFEYDKEHIKEDVLKKLKKYIEHKDFLPSVGISPTANCIHLTFFLFRFSVEIGKSQ